MKTLILIMAALMVSSPAIGRVTVGGKIFGDETSEAVRVHKLFNGIYVTDYCKLQTGVDASLENLIAHSNFPLLQNESPASDFVGPFTLLRFKAQQLGLNLRTHRLIWKNLTADKDKKLSQIERDNVVALWRYSKNWISINCEPKK